MNNHNEEDGMNAFDLILILACLLFGWVGYRQGLIIQLISLFSWIIAVWVAYTFTDEVAPVINQWITPDDYQADDGLALLPMDKMISSGIAFLLLFFGTRLLLRVLSSFINVVGKLPIISMVNGIGGLLLAELKLVILLLIGVNLLHVLPWEVGREAVDGSVISQAILQITPDITKSIKELFLGTDG
jgi:uncharacterized membrane protein required for colicin V production